MQERGRLRMTSEWEASAGAQSVLPQAGEQGLGPISVSAPSTTQPSFILKVPSSHTCRTRLEVRGEVQLPEVQVCTQASE